MKKFSLYPFAIAASLFVLAACSDDDDNQNNPPEPPVEIPFGPQQDCNYTDGAGLAITYNSEPLLGKVVSVTANPQDYSNPTLTIAGAPLDLNQIKDQAAPTLSKAHNETAMMIPTPGVLPGSPELTFPITLSDDGSFAGEGSTKYCSYKYAGTWNEENGIAIQFSDVTLLDQTLGDTSWELHKLPNENKWDDTDPDWVADGLYINWESSKNLDLFGYPMPINDVVTLAFAFATVEVGPAETAMPIKEALNVVLSDITFTSDGNIIATYLDEETGQYAVSPKNIAQYAIDNGVLKLFINPQAIIANELAAAERASRADEGGLDIDAIMGSMMGLMQSYMPYVATGFPLDLRMNNNEEGTDEYMTLYLNTEFMLPIMSAGASIISQPAILEMIKEAVAQDPVMGGMADMLEGMLVQLPGIVEGTTVLEAGLNLTKK